MQPQVSTSAGRLEGLRVQEVDAFLGVPFARPPLKDLRFRGPAPAEPWTGVRPAVQYGNAPAQLPSPFALSGPDIYAGLGPTGEDCLYLNVWTPVRPDERRPVLVWIPGGAFVRGAGSQTVYDGAVLAREHDVVVVTVNYRLGVFGFLAGDEQGTSNLGLRDQLAALRWVAENIDRFGGDPDRVTVFGESAGAVSIACLLAMPEAAGLFHRAIAQSGAGRRLATPELAQEWTEQVMQEAGVGSTAQLRELQTADLLQVQARVSAALFQRHGLSGGFQPWVDGELLSEQPVDAAVAGRTGQVELLAGWNRNELALWRALEPDLHAVTWAELSRRAGQAWGDLGSAHVALRRAEQPSAAPGQVWELMRTDVEFALPTLAFALGHLGGGAATYLYRFDWGGPSPADGACHFLEVPFVFGTLDAAGMSGCIGRSPATERLSAVMRQAWTSFARSGSPMLPDRSWPRADESNAVVLFDAIGEGADTVSWSVGQRHPLLQHVGPPDTNRSDTSTHSDSGGPQHVRTVG